MRADDAADDVVRGLDARHPVAHGFVDGVAERAPAARDRPHFGPQQLHAEDVELLPADVFLAHVDDAVRPKWAQAVAVATPCWPAPVSAMTRGLPIRSVSRAWPMRVVDLVGAGVVEVLALEVDVRAAALFAQPLGVIERRRPADVVLQQRGELGLKRGVLRRFVVFDGEFVERANERFGHVAAAERAEPPGGIGNLCCYIIVAFVFATKITPAVDCPQHALQNQGRTEFTTETLRARRIQHE